ncbi:protein phosphatase 2C domain-containing protein [Cellulomonas sp. ATA003]|uniref:PP2C family protein-serine/threonine phosphatase n=1 Tax=Cellulomonas sp. ATA003 TaxID=3073064 RepID=UPI002873657B|nr:protein phosphatase 2C domain-containing protein [Cellulomonas sp. ATA003]WNB85960.1 protein phosphatase 2C domain-containing protein [Cellulomonas sp. ATA003]
MRTSWGSATDRGRVRRLNEDALLAQPPLFLVADGMGGHDAGDVASRVTVEEFSRLADRDGVTHDDVQAAFARAAARVRESVGAGRTAGTTVAGAAVAAGGAPYWLVFNVGDSRVYRLADGSLEQVSVDHSVVQELIDDGRLRPADAEWHPDRHVITRAVGTGPVPEADYWLIPAGSADRLLLCSDGLTQELDDDAIRYLLMDQPDPQAAAQILVQAAVEAGGRDNVTAVVVDLGDARAAGVDEATIERPVTPPLRGDGTEQ